MTTASRSHSQRFMQWLVAVHGGAGDHSSNHAYEKPVKQSLRSACTQVVQSLRQAGRSIDVVEKAIAVLEDAECLNAGKGSNLTLEGHVECDASLMDGTDGAFGGVGAAHSVRNPIRVARAVLDNARKPRPLGRVPPLTLVGEGAHRFAVSTGLPTVCPDELITERTRREWKVWKDRLDRESYQGAVPSGGDIDYGECESSLLEDTVGAISCDSSGGMSAGVSSGGILLKHSGRIGEAATYGAGAWAHSPEGPTGERGISCSVSGTGEDIIRSSLARTIATALLAAPVEETSNVLYTVLQNFCDECKAHGEASPSAGAIVITKEPVQDPSGDEVIDSDFPFETETESADTSAATSTSTTVDYTPTPAGTRQASGGNVYKVRLWCAFTTSSMAIAYASSEDIKPRSLILRKPAQHHSDPSCVYLTALPLTR